MGKDSKVEAVQADNKHHGREITVITTLRDEHAFLTLGRAAVLIAVY